MTYTVVVADNFHYMDEDSNYVFGRFDTHEAAVEAAKEIVDDYLRTALQPGMTAEQLYDSYVAFGEDPYITSTDPPDHRFSAWDYAKQRSHVLCEQDRNSQ